MRRESWGALICRESVGRAPCRLPSLLWRARTAALSRTELCTLLLLESWLCTLPLESWRSSMALWTESLESCLARRLLGSTGGVAHSFHCHM